MTILLIEDDTNDALLLQRALRIYGLCNPIVTYSYPEAALEYLQDNYESTVLILLDLAFPGHMDGYEFLHRLHGTPARYAPVIILSGSEPYSPRAYQHGALDFLTKPVSAEKLITALHKIGLGWTIG